MTETIDQRIKRLDQEVQKMRDCPTGRAWLQHLLLEAKQSRKPPTRRRSDMRLPTKHSELTPEQSRIVENNLGLAHLLAKKHCRRVRSASYEETLSDAMLGLCIAAKLFDASKGYKFSTYAWRAIQTRIINGADQTSYKRRLRYTKLGRRLPSMTSMDQVRLVTERGGETMHDRIGYQPDYESTSDLPHLLATLDDRERYVIHNRFFEETTLEHIGRTLGVTKERVRQIERNALTKARMRI